MKLRFLTALGVVFVACLLAGCESSDEFGHPVPISGDSELMVYNLGDEDFGIYFDGQYIGKVIAHESRVWSVPSGKHVIAIKYLDGQTSTTQATLAPGQRATMMNMH
ncbi:MAG: hypothetical protein FJ225_08050 [Lentisphaerae bacterium]|nr:hypothetical protein [Lentisphaerota bacterium]